MIQNPMAEVAAEAEADAANPPRAAAAVDVTQLPLDVDAQILSVTSIEKAIEMDWLHKLKRAFVNVYKGVWDEQWGPDTWEDEFDAAWHRKFGKPVICQRSPWRVKRLLRSGVVRNHWQDSADSAQGDALAKGPVSNEDLVRLASTTRIPLADIEIEFQEARSLVSLAFSEKLIPLFEAHLSLLELAPDAASSRAGRRGDGKSLIEVAKDAGITNIDSISLFQRDGISTPLVEGDRPRLIEEIVKVRRAALGKQYSLRTRLTKKTIDCFLMPFVLRLPTDARKISSSAAATPSNGSSGADPASLLKEKIPGLRSATEAQMQQIVKTMHKMHYREGDIIVEEGAAAFCVYIVVEGDIRVVKGGEVLSSGGKQVLIRAGEVFGEDAVANDDVRSATCEAHTDVHVLRLHKNDVKAVVGERDEVTGEYRQDAEINDNVCNWDVCLEWRVGRDDVDTSIFFDDVDNSERIIAAIQASNDSINTNFSDRPEESVENELVKIYEELVFLEADMDGDGRVSDREKAVAEADQNSTLQISADNIVDFMSASRVRKMRRLRKKHRQARTLASSRALATERLLDIEGDGVQSEMLSREGGELLNHFQASMDKLDRIDHFLLPSTAARRRQVRELKMEIVKMFKVLLEKKMYRLTASDIAEFLTPARVQEIVQLAAAGKLSGGTGALETAARLPRLLRAVRRIQVLKRLRKSGLITCTKWNEDKSKLFTLISCPNDKLEYTAEQYKMQKHVLSRNRTARGPRVAFFSEDDDDPYPWRPYFESPLLDTEADKCVFSHQERETLIWRIIEGKDSKLTGSLDATLTATQSSAHVDVNQLVGSRILSSYFSLHHRQSVKQLQKDWAELPREKHQAFNWLNTKQPLNAIRDYFGDSVAWFFSFQGEYCRSLQLISLLGVFAWILQKVQADDTDDWQISPWFAVCLPLWCVLWYTQWLQTEKRTAYDWGVRPQDRPRQEFGADLRREFVSAMRDRYVAGSNRIAFSGSNDTRRSLNHGLAPLSKVLGVPQHVIAQDIEEFDLWWFPDSSRRWRVFLSWLATLFLMACSLVVMISTFDVQEAVEANSSRLFAYTAKGLLSGVLVPAVDFLYRKVATRLTEAEHHPRQQQHYESLAAKLLGFQFLNAFASMFYIAFFRSAAFYSEDGVYQQDRRIEQLTTELWTALVMHLLVGLAVKVLKPVCRGWNMVLSHIENYDLDGDGKLSVAELYHGVLEGVPVATRATTDTQQLFDEAEIESGANVWKGDLHDQINLCIQFGYITFFGAVWPLAPLLAWINQIVEIRIHAWRLVGFPNAGGNFLLLTRKPAVQAASDIGIWKRVILAMSILAALVNCGLLLVFHEETISMEDGSGSNSAGDDDLLRSWYMKLSPGESSLGADVCAFLVAVVLLEHGILALGGLMALMVPTVPRDLGDADFKQEYFKRKEHNEYLESRERRLWQVELAAREKATHDGDVAPAEDSRAQEASATEPSPADGSMDAVDMDTHTQRMGLLTREFAKTSSLNATFRYTRERVRLRSPFKAWTSRLLWFVTEEEDAETKHWTAAEEDYEASVKDYRAE